MAGCSPPRQELPASSVLLSAHSLGAAVGLVTGARRSVAVNPRRGGEASEERSCVTSGGAADGGVTCFHDWWR